MSLNVEALLREALHPVDPPVRLSQRLESRLAALTQAAQDELEGWELSAMRDPRNWGRTILAVSVTATAGTALVLVRVRARRHTRRDQSATFTQYAERTLQDLAEEARRVLGDR